MKGYSAVRITGTKAQKGRVRFVTLRKPGICPHIHKTKQSARECAKKMKTKIGGRWVVHSVEG